MPAATPWYKPTSTGEPAVVAHTPDGTRYHPPGVDPGMRVPSGRGGRGGAIVPRSTIDGDSRGFNHQRPGKVIVDPDRGGLVVDYAALARNPGAVQQALDAVGPDARDPRPEAGDARHAVMAMLGRPLSDVSEEELVPDYLKDPSQRQPPPPPPPAVVTVAAPPAAAPATAATDPKFEFAMPQPQPQPSNPLAFFQQMQQMAAAMGLQLTPAAAPPAPPVPAPPAPQPPATPLDRLHAADPPQALKQQPAVPAAASLKLPFLAAGRPQKPAREVVFALPGAGTMRARYHDAVVTPAAVVLVYDTRYEEGTQWLPPATAAAVTVTLPGRSGRDPDRTFVVQSLGLQFPLGCLDFVVLLKDPGEAAEAATPDELEHEQGDVAYDRDPYAAANDGPPGGLLG